jgi:hypothetical protein
MIKYLIPGFLAFTGIGFMAYFVIVGSHIDRSGYLVEQFWAWGLGLALVGLGVGWAIIATATSLMLRKMRN